MLKPTDLRPGNIILFDHNDRRRPAVPLIRGIVEEVRKDKVVLKGDIMLGYDRIAGLPIDEDLLVKFGFFKKPTDKYYHLDSSFSYSMVYKKATGRFGTIDIELEFAHRLQNIYYDLNNGQELKITVPESPPIHHQQ